MNIEKMRGEFEAAAEQHFMLKERYLYWDESEEEYEDPDVQLAYEFFLLSRERLEIELPTCEYANDASEYSKGHRQGIRTCREAIQSTGVKVK